MEITKDMLIGEIIRKTRSRRNSNVLWYGLR